VAHPTPEVIIEYIVGFFIQVRPPNARSQVIDPVISLVYGIVFPRNEVVSVFERRSNFVVFRADALQISKYSESEVMITADGPLVAVAKLEGLKAFNPISQDR